MILERILATTRELVARRMGEVPQAEVARQAAEQAACRDLVAALRVPPIRVIAEIKRASPSKGLLRPELDAVGTAERYAANGAAAISVLTEPAFFRGSLEDLGAVRRAVGLPVLRKDFIVDPYQVYEARAFGADAFLLIVAALEASALKDLRRLGEALGMTALVEVRDERELDVALSAEATIIGINNRNLADFSVDLTRTDRLRDRIPEGIPVVSESGIHTREDIARLAASGVNAVLIGEALVTSDDPGARLKELLGT